MVDCILTQVFTKLSSLDGHPSTRSLLGLMLRGLFYQALRITGEPIAIRSFQRSGHSNNKAP